MTDEAIIALYWQREPAAITETAAQYGDYCRAIAGRILGDSRDAEECLNDVWLRTWNAIPPQRPASLRLFLAAVTRNLAFDRYKAQHAAKRGGGLEPVLQELEECISPAADGESAVLRQELEQAVNRFLAALPPRDCGVFLRRYFYAEPVADIARRFGITAGHAAVILSRTRKKLKRFLQQEELI